MEGELEEGNCVGEWLQGGSWMHSSGILPGATGGEVFE